MWQSAAWPLDEHTGNPEWNYIVTAANHFDVWYPGDAYVDWVSLSAFYGATYNQVQWACKTPSTSPRALQDRVLNFARAHNKPVMIAEAAPQGFTNGSKTRSCIFSKSPQATTGDAIWNTWYADFFGYIAANTDVIRAVAYINTNWDAQPNRQCNGAPAGQPGCANGYWGDSRVQADATVKGRFLSELRNARWVNGSGGGTSPERTIRGVGSNRCLDVSGGRTADGTKIQLWDCLNNAAQKWRVEANGPLVNPQSGKCLDADGWGTANGTQMIIWTCGSPVQSNQNWVVS